MPTTLATVTAPTSSTTPTTDYSKLISTIGVRYAKFIPTSTPTSTTPSLSTTVAPTSEPAPVKNRCPVDEYYDEIEQACYPKDAPTKLVASETPTRDIYRTRETSEVPPPEIEEDIDENGFSTAPEPKPTLDPIPDSDGSGAGSQTVTRTKTTVAPSPQGSGKPTVGYNYPSSGGQAPGPSPLNPMVLPNGAKPVQAAQPFYKSPVVLLGGGALLAYLLLRKK